MASDEQLKELVRQKYSEIALQDKEINQASCCGSGCCSTEVHNIMNEDYNTLEGYNPDADLGLGCGLPTQFAKIREGDTVIDLGSGAGNDCFIARAEVGGSGKVIGIDFTSAMIEKSRQNAAKLGFTNVEFREGDIESMPLTSNLANVVVSNCVLNLVPNKNKVFSEIYRTLKPGGHFSISDIVLEGHLPDKWKQVAELYAGCIAGAIQKQDYIRIIVETGFTNIALQKEKDIRLPMDIMQQYFSEEEIREYKNSGTSIKSITVYGEKPVKDARNGGDLTPFILAPANNTIRSSIIALLQSENLPTDDLPEDISNFITATNADTVIGVIGLEQYGNYGLLRSLVVHKSYRNRHIANALIREIEYKAGTNNLDTIYLLTETAPDYFARAGYEKITRDDVPAVLLQSSEFSHVCPASAIVMKKNMPSVQS